VIGETYIDFITATSSVIKDKTNSIQGAQRTPAEVTADGTIVIYGNY
jgi:hypothetical protein